MYPGADIGSDHQLLMAEIRLKLKAKKNSPEVSRFDAHKMFDLAVRMKYNAEISRIIYHIISYINFDKTQSNI